jgi:hypothetical protein
MMIVDMITVVGRVFCGGCVLEERWDFLAGTGFI